MSSALDVIEREPFGPRHPLSLAVFLHQQRFIREVGGTQHAAAQVGGRADGEHFFVEDAARGEMRRDVLPSIVEADIEFAGESDASPSRTIMRSLMFG